MKQTIKIDRCIEARVKINGEYKKLTNNLIFTYIEDENGDGIRTLEYTDPVDIKPGTEIEIIFNRIDVLYGQYHKPLITSDDNTIMAYQLNYKFKVIEDYKTELVLEPITEFKIPINKDSNIIDRMLGKPNNL